MGITRNASVRDRTVNGSLYTRHSTEHTVSTIEESCKSHVCNRMAFVNHDTRGHMHISRNTYYASKTYLRCAQTCRSIQLSQAQQSSSNWNCEFGRIGAPAAGLLTWRHRVSGVVRGSIERLFDVPPRWDRDEPGTLFDVSRLQYSEDIP